MMKQIVFTILCLQIFMAMQASAPVIVNGKWERGGKDVSLYKVISGRLEVLSTYNLQEDKTFGFYFTPESEGYYVIGNGYPQAQINKYVFYFKPGDVLNVEINDSTYVLAGENTPENKALAEWHEWIRPLEFIAIYFYKGNYTYVDFFPKLEEAIANPFSPQPTSNKQFNEAFARFREYDFINTAVHFLHTPRTAHPHEDDFPDFYRNLNIEKLTKDAFLLNYPYGSKLLSNLFYLKQRFSENDTPLSLEKSLPLIINDRLKGEYLLHRASAVKTYVGYKDLIDPYEKYIITPDQKSRASDIIAKLAKSDVETGNVAINFTHKDINGKDVSLSDFKEKVVLVDVWATWCGPCKGELPHFKDLEKQYAGKDIVFMGVSVDEEKDLQKWKDFIKKEELKGIQLFAGGFESDIAKFYDIKSIPRFLLFDKKGNIVSKDAPRPSSAELKVLIDNELKK